MPLTGKGWQLHASHLGMLSRCGEQFRRRYIEGEIIPPGVAAITGSGAHKAIATDLSRKIDTGELAPIEELRDSARDYVDTQFSRGAYRLAAEDKVLGRQHWRDESVDWAVRFAECHHVQLAPELFPTHTERKWVIKLRGFPCDLAGMLDVQELWPTGELVVRDTKTGGKKKDPDLSLQLTMYAMAVRVLEGTMPASLVLDNILRRKRKGQEFAEILSLMTTRSDDDFKALLRRVETASRQIEAGVFPPADPDHWLCSPKWCGFHATCPYQRGRKSFPIRGLGDE